MFIKFVLGQAVSIIKINKEQGVSFQKLSKLVFVSFKAFIALTISLNSLYT